MSGKPGGAKWKRVKSACFERDRKRNAPCWICGHGIDYLANNDPQSEGFSLAAWEPDHFYSPLTHPHLAYDPANLRPSHVRCNRKRGQAQRASMNESAALGNLERDW